MEKKLVKKEKVKSEEFDLIKRGNAVRYIELLYDNIIWIILLLTIVVCSFTIPVFFSVANFRSVFLSSSAIGILVIAESLVLITGNFDLSIESILGIYSSYGWMVDGPLCVYFKSIASSCTNYFYNDICWCNNRIIQWFFNC